MDCRAKMEGARRNGLPLGLLSLDGILLGTYWAVVWSVKLGGGRVWMSLLEIA